jgi:hypothetical protein
MLRLTFLAVSVLVLLSSCVTTRPWVSERSDDLQSRPDWATLDKSMSRSSGVVSFLGYVEVAGDSSKSAALNMADEKALSEPMRSIVGQFLDQNQVGEELRRELNIGQRIISAARNKRATMPSLSITRRYWETVVVPQSGLSDDLVHLRVYSLAEVPAAEFKAARAAVISELSANTEVGKILNEVGQKQREALKGASDAK